MIWADAFKLLKAIPAKAWLSLILLAAIAAGVSALRSHWIGVGESRVRAEWDEDKAKAAIEHAKRVEEVRLQEQAEVARQSAIAWNLFQENQHAQAEIDRLRRDLAAGTVRVRERFRCPNPGRVPDAADTTSGSDAASERGLRDEDAEFLIRLAGEADAIARRLTACQDILRGVQ